jgi:type II secretory ATPase GspE/PulE/Tfp pilus assembly ATPase PilB-like protein
MAQKRGAKGINFLETKEFERQAAEWSAKCGNTEHSELQQYAINLIAKAYQDKASDIHIYDYGNRGNINFRCLGMMRPHEVLPGTKVKDLIGVIYGTLSEQQSSTSHTPSIQQDARIANRTYLPPEIHSLRVHTEPLEYAQDGCAMFLRLLHDTTSATGKLSDRLSMLGHSEHSIRLIRTLCDRKGINLISGGTGHGKTTLLKHVMEAQAEEKPEKCYIAVEDPSEYPLDGVLQFKVNTGAVGMGSNELRELYGKRLGGTLRSDLDTLMIGEIRYPEAASQAIDAALSSHTVWATIHASSALGIIRRMVSRLSEAGVADPLDYLCDPAVMSGLIYQCLVPILCPECKVRLVSAGEDYKKRVLPDYVWARVQKAVNSLEQVHIRSEFGCEHCDNIGFVKQTVVAEAIATDDKLLNRIQQGDIPAAREYWLKEMGGKSHIQYAVDGIENGEFDPYMTEIRLGTSLIL